MSGYIVNCEMEAGGPTVLRTRPNSIWPHVPPAGVLLQSGRMATVFATRADAEAAIRRTMSWWDSQGRYLDWPDDSYTVRRLVAVSRARGDRR